MLKSLYIDPNHICGKCKHTGKCVRNSGKIVKNMMISYRIENRNARNERPFVNVYECKGFELDKEFVTNKREAKHD